MRESSGHQPGDPRLAALAIVEAVQSNHPPLRLLLGRDALLAARGELDELRDEFAAWEPVTIGADAPERARE